MTHYDVKHELGKHIPISFRNAVLDRFTVDQSDDRVTVRLSYYHLKSKNTIHVQMMVLHRELDYLGASYLKDIATQLLRRLKQEAKLAKPIEHIKITLTVQND